MMSKQLTSLNILGLYLHLGSAEGYYSWHLGWGKPLFWETKPRAGYYSYTGREYKSFLFSGALESLAGISSLAKDVDQGQPLS
jgi:hypothetical protein